MARLLRAQLLRWRGELEGALEEVELCDAGTVLSRAPGLSFRALVALELSRSRGGPLSEQAEGAYREALAANEGFRTPGWVDARLRLLYEELKQR